jgi:hypothetical protein
LDKVQNLSRDFKPVKAQNIIQVRAGPTGGRLETSYKGRLGAVRALVQEKIPTFLHPTWKNPGRTCDYSKGGNGVYYR